MIAFEVRQKISKDTDTPCAIYQAIFQTRVVPNLHRTTACMSTVLKVKKNHILYAQSIHHLKFQLQQ